MMADDESSFEDRIKRSRKQMKLIKRIACDLYHDQARFSDKDFKRAVEMMQAMRLWGCTATYHYVIAGTLQFFVSNGFIFVPLLPGMYGKGPPVLEFVPNVHLNWFDAVRETGTHLLFAGYGLWWVKQQYALYIMSCKNQCDCRRISISFWDLESLEGRGRCAYLETRIIRRFVEDGRLLWLAFYIQEQMKMRFTNKLKIAFKNRHLFCQARLLHRPGDPIEHDHENAPNGCSW